MEIDRRHVLLGSGLAAFALSGCGQDIGNEADVDMQAATPKAGANWQSAADAASLLSRAIFDARWNVGDKPWDRVDEVVNAPSTTATFAPRYITVLHFEL